MATLELLGALRYSYHQNDGRYFNNILIGNTLKKGFVMEFVLYCRVSTAKQDLGLDAQKAQAQRYSNSVGGRIVSIYSEHESGKNDNRPQLALAIADARARHATLLIAKLDRLSRRVAFLFSLKEELARAGVDVVAADMPDVIKDTLTLGIFASLAQKERELISMRTKAALDTLKAKGKKLGKPRGYDMSRAVRESVRVRMLRADEWAHANLPVIAGFRDSGRTYKDIAEILNNQGMRTRKGCFWTASAVRLVYKRKI